MCRDMSRISIWELVEAFGSALPVRGRTDNELLWLESLALSIF